MVDLHRQYQRYQSEIDAAVADVVHSASFIGCADFERDFSAYHHPCHCVGLGNATDALMLACRALGIGPGDEVIVPSLTFFASAEAVSAVGATPVFAEVDPKTYGLDIGHAQTLRTAKTKAVLAVHLYGQAINLRQLSAWTQAEGLYLIEDCAQAVGARYDGQLVGTVGDVGCFSFFPSKNLGAWGDGGAVITRHSNLAERIRSLANHGRSAKYRHQEIGVNSRLDAIQGAVLQVKLRHLDEIIAGRRRAAAAYRQGLADLSDRLTLPFEDPNGLHVYHLFVIQTDRRDALQQFLNQRGIEATVHYPLACHAQPAYTERKISLPHTEALTQRVLSLPLFPEITDAEIAYVCEAVHEFYAIR